MPVDPVLHPRMFASEQAPEMNCSCCELSPVRVSTATSLCPHPINWHFVCWKEALSRQGIIGVPQLRRRM